MPVIPSSITKTVCINTDIASAENGAFIEFSLLVMVSFTAADCPGTVDLFYQN